MNGLDVLLGPAVFAYKGEIHQQARSRLARDRQRCHRVRELHAEQLQYRANSERILVDQLSIDLLKVSRVHA
jgi:uncharacterized ParB-like nuclease family protein